MAIFVRATKGLPNMLVKEVDNPYNDFSKFKEKYFVKRYEKISIRLIWNGTRSR